MPPEMKSRDEHVADADRIIAECGEPFQSWLAQASLDVAQAQPYQWGPLTSSLRSQGKLPQAEAWIVEQQNAMPKLGVTQRKRTAGEIARRFLAAAMERVEASSRPMKNQTKYLSHLPPHYVWAGNHPDFIPLPEDAPESACVKRREEIERYERQNPAPNQMAINMLIPCQLDKTARKDLFKETNNFTRDERKKTKAPATEEEKRENQRILDMKAEKDKLAAKYGKARMPT